MLPRLAPDKTSFIFFFPLFFFFFFSPLFVGEALDGNHISNSLYKINFRETKAWEKLCETHLQKADVEAFKKAIAAQYYFEFFLDDLPVRGFIGAPDEGVGKNQKFFLFKHLHFSILYNRDRVIHANVSADIHQVQVLENDAVTVEFSYSVEWTESNVAYEKRMTLFHDSFFEQDLEIHWLSILNSLVLVLLLTGFVVLILRRVLHSDFDRYARKAENPEDEVDDSGWKLVHGDVFRLPPLVTLLSAFCGAGVHLILLGATCIVMAICGYFPFGDKGAAYATIIILFACTSFFGGLVSAGMHRHLRGTAWHWNVVLNSFVFSGPFLAISLLINIISASYRVTNALSLEMMATMFLIWLLVVVPLTILGGVAGRRLVSELNPPVRISNFVRSIPGIPLYKGQIVQFVVAGFLPFSAIYIELYYVYLSVWGRNYYTLYGILLLVSIILLCVTSCMTIAMLYFQLSQEDHEWWWRSFFNGGATGLFVYLYSCYYFFLHSQMSGFLQTAVYFIYMLLASYAFFLVLGTTGFISSYIFVSSIYSNIKTD